MLYPEVTFLNGNYLKNIKGISLSTQYISYKGTFVEELVHLGGYTMKRLILLVVASTLITGFNASCVSYYTNRSVRKTMALNRAIASNDEKAIQAIKLGTDGAGIGYDIGVWEAISERPGAATVAALGDAAILYGTYAGVKYFNDQGGGDSKSEGSGNDISATSGNDSTVLEINGDGNNVEITQNSNNSSTTP
ncbi:MAG: hypothetical protein WC375_03390 [Methanomassiliicoccales archaeon]